MTRRRSIAGTGCASLAERKDDLYPFSNRLPMMHSAGWEGPKATSATSFAWFVWEAGHRGQAEVQRISWEPAP
jgi:hypothetical protein